ncbi:DUF935 family protein, partial [Telmatospirillum sp. J64-1]|uniref:phage portal protein family protein n=1 Tax=Telmatospirillum sp. J64-1 TaxID=2502183 RepID=UPI00115D52C9
PGAAVPRVWRRVEAEEDLDARASREEIIARTTGLRPTQQHVEDTYGGQWERPQAAVHGPAGLAFAEAKARRDGLDDLTDQLEQIAEPAMSEMIGQIEALLGEVGSLEELHGRLLALYPRLDAGSLAGLLGEALALADLQGRAEILDA